MKLCLLLAFLTAAARADSLIVIAQDGTGDFRSIQAALDQTAQVPGRLILEIRRGTYDEPITVRRENVTFQGKDAKTTVITGHESALSADGTYQSATVHIVAPGFEATQITFENTFGTGSQAVAVSVRSDNAKFRQCRFTAWQDTLYASQGRMRFEDCYIEGHVDFIFGDAEALFEHCEIHSRGPGYITAQGRTTPDSSTGYTFRNCHLTGENTGKGVYLGRPWRPYAKVAYIDCTMDQHIRPEGWDNWRNPANEATATFTEQNSNGPGASPNTRVKWAKTLP